MNCKGDQKTKTVLMFAAHTMNSNLYYLHRFDLFYVSSLSVIKHYRVH